MSSAEVASCAIDVGFSTVISATTQIRPNRFAFVQRPTSMVRTSVRTLPWVYGALQSVRRAQRPILRAAPRRTLEPVLWAVGRMFLGVGTRKSWVFYDSST